MESFKVLNVKSAECKKSKKIIIVGGGLVKIFIVYLNK